MSSPVARRRATRVRMVALPASVPAVRRFVDEALTTWGREDLVDDVGLTVTELATNATLHSTSSYFDVELARTRHGARLAVVDSGSLPAPQIAARVDLREVASPEDVDAAGSDDLDALELELESMTGRGLIIVASLAARWGIEELPGGTRVWADFRSGGGAQYAVVPPQLAPAGTGRSAPVTVPAQVRVVPIRLLGCPPRLLLAHDDNLADIVRELALFGASHRDRDAGRTSQQVAEVVRSSAVAWDGARLLARHALEEGRPIVDIAIAADPTALPAKLAVLRRALTTAEAMAGAGLLMTLPAPAPVQRWRDWVEQELLAQGTTGRRPRPFDAAPTS